MMRIQAAMPVSSGRSSLRGEAQNLRAELAETRLALERETAARKQLERALLDAVETEQRRVSQRLHDTVCQSLSGIHLLARVLVRKLRAAGSPHLDEVAELGEMIQHAANDLHDLERWLRPAVNDALPLVPALAELARTASKTTPCELHCPEPVAIADRYAELQLLHLAHEAVSHALGRDGVRQMVISLSVGRAHGATLEVHDDGHVDTTERPDREPLALERLRHRASIIGGVVTIFSQPNRGHTIRCQLPLSN